MQRQELRDYLNDFKKDIDFTNFRRFKDRAFILTSEKSKQQFLDMYPDMPGFYREIITEKTVNYPEILNPKKTFLFFGHNNVTNDKKIINNLIKMFFNVTNYKHPEGTKGFVRYYDNFQIQDFVEKNFGQIARITDNFVNPWHYVRFCYAVDSGYTTFLWNYVKEKNFKYIECEQTIPRHDQILFLGGVSYINEIHRFRQYIEDTGFIYAYEPSPTRFKGIESELLEKEKERTKIFERGLSNINGKLPFIDNGEQSVVDQTGTSTITAIRLDDYHMGQKCDLLKLNLNGHEYEALQGGHDFIKKWRPKLMIRLVPKNMVKIPDYLLSIHDDYKFYVGYYDQYNYMEDIILYAY